MTHWKNHSRGAATYWYHADYDDARELAEQGYFWEASRYAYSAAEGRQYVTNTYYNGRDQGPLNHQRAINYVTRYADRWASNASWAVDNDPWGRW